jgi:sec-independent protein translocase protein TatB
MFNIGFSELLILGVIALIFIGPQQLPEVARTIGRLLNEWKRATGDLQNQFTSTLRDDITEKRNNSQTEQSQLPPTDHDVAVRVKQETPDSASLPEGVAPVAGHNEDKK